MHAKHYLKLFTFSIFRTVSTGLSCEALQQAIQISDLKAAARSAAFEAAAAAAAAGLFYHSKLPTTAGFEPNMRPAVAGGLEGPPL